MEVALKSEIGNVRLENQDCVRIVTNNNFIFMVLCDGMGGYLGGAQASQIAVNTLNKHFLSNLPHFSEGAQAFANWFKSAIQDAKKEMISIAENDKAKMDMGTTITAVLVNKVANIFYVFNVGDSRTYIFTKYKQLEQITKDQSYLNQLIDEGVDPIEAKKNRFARLLTSALGPMKKIKIDMSDYSNFLKDVKSIICTSDGVHEFISKPTFEAILVKNYDVEETCQILINEALKNNSNDNVSVGIIDFDK